MVYGDIIEYNIVGDTKTRLLCCILFISTIKIGDLISTRQNMKYQSFTKLQFKGLMKESFHSIKIELRDTTGKIFCKIRIMIFRTLLKVYSPICRSFEIAAPYIGELTDGFGAFTNSFSEVFDKVPVLETIVSSYTQEIFTSTSLDESN